VLLVIGADHVGSRLPQAGGDVAHAFTDPRYFSL